MFAVYNATKAARELALKNKPVLIESMTYRLGHHSTSDDSSFYRYIIYVDLNAAQCDVLFTFYFLLFRTPDEVKEWGDKDHPITRFKKYIMEKGWWTDEDEKKWQTEVGSAMQRLNLKIKGEGRR